ncbi:MAG: hypothetical protein C7B46_20415 [Sulfobacillus benefaciens]|uniref:Uncharacterized protein n=1 Tax=Sulfobacillus benefaciens TaxID=453960 RepID=A0A2T2WUQ1_9FIRM|nr:MAG: hypothetical protein C7B46_20415 [Sulfobacillus benefaciens]
MAFVRWRGHSAQLLTTVYDQGRSRQILWANLHGAYATTPSVRKAVAAEFPDVVIDWHAVDQALAIGPSSSPPPSPAQLEWATVASWLQDWAMDRTQGFSAERAALQAAAQVLTAWQARRPG